jgi:hypothetical protein
LAFQTATNIGFNKNAASGDAIIKSKIFNLFCWLYNGILTKNNQIYASITKSGFQQ